MRALASFVTGRRTKWLVPLVWLVLAGAMAPVGAKLADETKDEAESFLPSSAESTKVTRLFNDRFASGQTVDGLVVYRRAGGLTSADRRKLSSDAQRARRALPLIGAPVLPFGRNAPAGLVSANGDVAYSI